MKQLLVTLFTLAGVITSGAVERKAGDDFSSSGLYYHNLAVSVALGAGLPVGDFSNSRIGNAKSGGVANLGAEYFVSDRFSLGFEFSRGILKDDDDRNFENRVDNYQIFGRYLVPAAGRVRPYGKFGLGLSTITYQDQDFGGLGTLTSTSDPGLSLALGGGAAWRVSELVGINGGLGYHAAFLSNSEVANSGLEVGYDPTYFSIDFGVSFYIRR